MRHLTRLDHGLVLVDDLTAARDAYARLGFVLSSRGDHGAEMGTANHTVMFDDTYLELLSVVNPTPFNSEFQQAPKGLIAVALHADDADAAVAEVREAGVTATDPFTVSRDVLLPDGSKAEVTFRTSIFDQVGRSPLRLFCSQSLTPQHVWTPPMMAHPNTAHTIQRIGVVTDGKDLGLSEVFGDIPIVALDPDDYTAADRVVVTLTVRDIAQAKDLLLDSQVRLRETDNGIVVPPEEACGVTLELTERP